jgi:hypothetical protein
MKLHGYDIRVGITIGDGRGLASGSCATIENVLAMPDHGRDQLRGFILNDAEACSESCCSGNISAQNSPSGSEESTGS